MGIKFTLEYWKDEGWYVGRLREVPGIFSQGETFRELEGNIRDAYRLMVADQRLPKIHGRSKPILIST